MLSTYREERSHDEADRAGAQSGRTRSPAERASGSARLRRAAAHDVRRGAGPDDHGHRAADDRRRVGLSQLTWVVTVYVLAAAALTPIWGKVSDLFGRRGLLRAAILVFLAGSALSGVAQNIPELIAFRALQGAGAGGVMTLAMATVGDIFSPRERGRYQ